MNADAPIDAFVPGPYRHLEDPARDLPRLAKDPSAMAKIGAAVAQMPTRRTRCSPRREYSVWSPPRARSTSSTMQLMDGRKRTSEFSSGIATALQAVRFDRTSRIPTPPALSNREPVASRHSAGPAPRSVRTSRASRWRESSGLSFGCSPRADARSIHARRPLFASGEKSDPAYPVGRGDAGESGSPESVPHCGRPALDWCPSRGLDASALIAPRRLAHRRVVGSRSRRASPSMPNTSIAGFHARSGSSQG